MLSFNLEEKAKELGFTSLRQMISTVDIGIHPRTISRWEKGECRPKRDTERRIKLALGKIQDLEKLM